MEYRFTLLFDSSFGITSKIMLIVSPENTTDYLREHGILRPDESPKVEPLAWGVSNLVLRVNRSSAPDIVIKQSQTQLRTQVEWFSQRERIFREVEVMRYLNTILPEGLVPQVLFEDRENFLFGMQAIEADHQVWKAELLAGRIDVEIGTELGNILARIHADSSADEKHPGSLDDQQVFDELRIDPFYRYIARNDDTLQPAIDEIIERMSQHCTSLVLADFSPKNILILKQGLSLVDFETAHWGDPAFDLGFFLSHLWLKAIAHFPETEAMLRVIEKFCVAYQSELTKDSGALGSIVELEQRSLKHLGACMIARVDGKSPVDYLRHDHQQTTARNLGRMLLLGLTADWAEVETCFHQSMIT